MNAASLQILCLVLGLAIGFALGWHLGRDDWADLP